MKKTYKIDRKNGTITYFHDDVDVLTEAFYGVVSDGYCLNEFAESLENDKAFGDVLVNEFLVDNRISPLSFNPQLSISVLQKFQIVKALAEVGDIKNVMLMLGLIETDELFTQERKDKYILMCEKHLAL